MWIRRSPIAPEGATSTVWLELRIMKNLSLRFPNRAKAAVAVTLFVLAAAGLPAAEQELSLAVRQQITALLQEKATRTPAQLKLDSQLIYAMKMRRGEPVAPGV